MKFELDQYDIENIIYHRIDNPYKVSAIAHTLFETYDETEDLFDAIASLDGSIEAEPLTDKLAETLGLDPDQEIPNIGDPIWSDNGYLVYSYMKYNGIVVYWKEC